MLKTGLVSISFRQSSPKEVIDLVKKAGLEAIEWGGDIHVPHGDKEKAKEIKALCEAAEIATPSYGSYYKAGPKEGDDHTFSKALACAMELKCDTIRIWAGEKGSDKAEEEYRSEVGNDIRHVACIAEKVGITISLEYHANTLTDTNDSAYHLIKNIDHPNVKLYWQPPNGKSIHYCVEGLNMSLKYLTNIHSFHWETTDKGNIRLPLEKGIDRWKEYLKTAATTGKDHFVMLEFVKDDEPDNFLADANILKRLIKEANGSA